MLGCYKSTFSVVRRSFLLLCLYAFFVSLALPLDSNAAALLYSGSMFQGVPVEGGGLAPKSPWVGFDVTFKPSDEGMVYVVDVELSSSGLVLGSKSFQCPSIRLVASGGGREQVVNTRVSSPITLKGRSVRTALKGFKGCSKITLMVKNGALDGRLNVSWVKVWGVPQGELGNYDYPVTWDSLFSKRIEDVQVSRCQLDFTSLNRNLFGYNFHFVNPRGGQIVSDPMIGPVNPSLIRFPGGTIANFYKWECDCLNQDDLKDFPVFNERGWYRDLFKQMSHRGDFHRDEVLKWCAKNDIQLGIMLNPFVSNVNSLVQYLESLRQAGVSVAFVEIGNEMYDNSQRGVLLAQDGQYDQIVVNYCSVLKQKFPDLKCGVSFSMTDMGWNKRLGKLKNTYDAIVLHVYPSVSSVSTVEDDQYLLRYPFQGFPEAIDEVESFAPEMPFWITEWNFIDKPLYRRVNSHVGRMFSVNMLVAMIRDARIQYAAYHALFDVNFGIINLKIDYEGKLTNKQKGFQYTFWEFVHYLFENYNETSYWCGADGCVVQFFKNSHSNAFLVINNNTYPVRVNMSNSGEFEKTFLFNYPGESEDVDFMVVQPMSVCFYETKKK